MQKLKKQKFYNLINYQSFLKNNYLKKNIFNLKNILFENHLLFKNPNSGLNVIELNNYENIFLLTNIFNSKLIYTIKTQYENHLLFNYNLDSQIVSHFNKLIFKNFIKKNKTIKGHIVGGNNKKVFISIFGIIFTMKTKNLNNLVNTKKKFYFYNKKNKRRFFYKRIQGYQIIKYYVMKYLNFNIETIKDSNFNKKWNLSRISYIDRILENKDSIIKKKMYIRMKKKKRILSRKKHAHKMNKKI